MLLVEAIMLYNRMRGKGDAFGEKGKSRKRPTLPYGQVPPIAAATGVGLMFRMATA